MYGGFLESIFTGPHYATILLYDRRTTSQACGPSVSTEIRSSPILDLACAQNINVLAHLPAKVLLSGKMANVGRVTSAHNTSHAFCWPCTIISTTTQQRIVMQIRRRSQVRCTEKESFWCQQILSQIISPNPFQIYLFNYIMFFQYFFRSVSQGPQVFVWFCQACVYLDIFLGTQSYCSFDTYEYHSYEYH